ncbi:MAG TPA: YeeE/YedE thiosulfate transporter family protein [Gemmatimonadota bacterium]|nr:YeeE/YedE thiosulfate transporter family protein [Gemmatimonadota bacterium]
MVFAIGVYFGIVLIKSEAASWFRIQEMFRFGSFHMYGILGSAVVLAGLSLIAIRRLGLRDPAGRPARIEPKEPGRTKSRLAGGLVFGCGWALLGACPGPIYALIGTGVTVLVVALASAVAGAWSYGHLRPKLPH